MVSYVAVDIETTGADHISAGIYEIAAVKVSGGNIIETFQTFVKTSRELPYHIRVRRKLSPEIIKQFPSYETALNSFLDFIGMAPLVFHNKTFDLRFIEYKLYKKLGKQLFNETFCTMEELRYSNFKLTNLKLGNAATELGILNPNPHFALNDAIVCANVMGLLIGEPVSKTSEQYLERPIIPIIIE